MYSEELSYLLVGSRGNPQPPSSIDVDEIGHEVLPSAEP